MLATGVIVKSGVCVLRWRYYARANPFRCIGVDGYATLLGGELHLIVGVGGARVSCYNESGATVTMDFHKACIEAIIGMAMLYSYVFGLDGENCNPKNYQGWVWEFNAQPAIAAGAGIGKYASEIGFGIGAGTPYGISGCYYRYCKTIDYEPCSC